MEMEKWIWGREEVRGGTGRRGGRGNYSQDVMYKRRIEAKKKKRTS